MKLNSDDMAIISELLLAKFYEPEKFMSGYETEEFSIQKIGMLCDLINEEFMARGLSDNWEPSSYGVLLEKLLDSVNRTKLKKPVA